MNSEIPKYMKAAVLWKTGEKLLIKDRIEIPKLKAGQVLVKLAYSGVCQSQLMELKGLRGKNIFLPHLLGHEGCGQVVKISKNVHKIKKNVILSLKTRLGILISFFFPDLFDKFLSKKISDAHN